VCPTMILIAPGKENKSLSSLIEPIVHQPSIYVYLFLHLFSLKIDVHVLTDSTTITQDDYVPHILHKDQQAELDCSVHSGKLLIIITSPYFLHKNDKGTYNLFLCYLLCLHILNFHRYSGRFCCFFWSTAARRFYC